MRSLVNKYLVIFYVDLLFTNWFFFPLDWLCLFWINAWKPSLVKALFGNSTGYMEIGMGNRVRATFLRVSLVRLRNNKNMVIFCIKEQNRTVSYFISRERERERGRGIILLLYSFLLYVYTVVSLSLSLSLSSWMLEWEENGPGLPVMPLGILLVGHVSCTCATLHPFSNGS